MTEWRETWRNPANCLPEEEKFVVVFLGNGYVRGAFFKDGRFMSGTKEGAYELDIEGGIPFPRKRKRLAINEYLPADVAVPHLAAELRQAQARIAYLESLLENANMRKGKDYF